MDNNDAFKMTYSAQQQEEIDRIRKKYVPQEQDKMQQLRTLDASTEKKAMGIAITVGVVGTLIMGAGMSIVMTDLGDFFGRIALIIGIILGLLGIAVLAYAYPLYNRILKKEREKIAPEVLRIIDEIQNIK